MTGRAPGRESDPDTRIVDDPARRPMTGTARPESALDAYVPLADASDRHAVTVEAPADLVFDVAVRFDIQSLRSVAAIFRLRALLLGSSIPARPRRGFVEDMLSLGWGLLTHRPGDLFVAGATCRPWEADVVFHSIPADRFATFADPGQVKIVWSLEARPLSASRSMLVVETRAVATDESARRKFRRYWRWARFGIVAIRWLMLPAIRARAERQWRDQRDHSQRTGPRC